MSLSVAVGAQLLKNLIDFAPVQYQNDNQTSRKIEKSWSAVHTYLP